MDWEAKLLAVWYTGPFDYHSPAGLPYRITADTEMAFTEGEQVEVRIESYSDRNWELVESLTGTSGALSTPQ